MWWVMSLENIFTSIIPEDNDQPREKEACKRLIAKLDESPDNVTDSELLDGLGECWDCEIPFPKICDRLMEALAFTKERVPTDPAEILHAWATYLKNCGARLSFHSYPILQGIAYWYEERSADPSMAVRAISVYEFLYRSYDYIIQEQGVEYFAKSYIPPLIQLWRQLKNFSRSKHLIQWMEDQYHAGYLRHEDYLNLMMTLEEIIIEERGTDVTDYERELIKILKITWDTISDRDRQIEKHREEALRFAEQLACSKDETYPQAARNRLETRFGTLWNRLHQNTRRKLELVETYTQHPYSEHNPEVVPDALFLAIKNETLAQIFEPYGKSHSDIWPSLKNENPVGLLIRYRKRDLSRSVCVAVRDAIREAGCEPKFLSDDNVKKLCLLLRHRNQVQHFEEHPPYKISHLQELLKQVWNNFWIVNFLKKIHGSP
jgi:hypothetical protein